MSDVKISALTSAGPLDGTEVVPIVQSGATVKATTANIAGASANNSVTNAKLAQMAAHTFKGNNTGSTANALDLTATQLTAELNAFTTLLKGLVPASGGGTTTFLRADGSFAVPPGTATGTVTSVSVITANGVSGSVATDTTTPAITLTLGAITPTSVAASGTVTGSNLSGTNTGDQTNISGNAATVTTNANLTGPITSVGNATSIASQTGTGTTFAMSASPTFTGTVGAAAITATGLFTNSSSGAASTSSAIFTGTLFTGGTGTTTFPALFMQPTGTTAVTGWSTGGTWFGVNAGSGFAGSFLDCHVAGAASVFSVSSVGTITNSGNISTGGLLTSTRNGSTSNGAFSLTGSIVTGGTGTNNLPHAYINTSGATAPTTWSTSGTALGMNLASSFVGNFVDFRKNGSTTLFNVNYLGVVQTASQIYTTPVSLTAGATVAWDMNAAPNAKLTAAQNFTLSAPSNIIAGSGGMLVITQDATGSRVITWDSAYKFAAGTPIVLSTAANAIDAFSWYSPDGTNVYISGGKGFA